MAPESYRQAQRHHGCDTYTGIDVMEG